MDYFTTVNWLAVVLATIASMALGAGWYTLFGERWMAATGKTKEQLMGSSGGGSPVPFIWAGACQLVIAFFIAKWMPAVTGATNVQNGLIFGALAWLAFILTSMIINHRYQSQKWSLTLIDGGYLLGVTLLQGAVIGLFG